MSALNFISNPFLTINGSVPRASSSESSPNPNISVLNRTGQLLSEGWQNLTQKTQLGRARELSKLREGLRQWGQEVANNEKAYGQRCEAAIRIVACFESQSTELNLDGLELSSLPPQIGQLRHLQHLRLGNNKLSTLPPEIKELQSLKELDLTGNRFSALPAEVFQLRMLEKLILQGNHLRFLPAAIGKLRNLTHFDLSHNQFQYLPASIGLLNNLRKLNVSYNQLKELPDSIKYLFQLTEFDANDNLPELIAKLPSIRKENMTHGLQAWCNKVKGTAEYQSRCRAKQRILQCFQSDSPILVLNGLGLTELPPQIGQLTALQRLDLIYNQLTTLPSEFENLTALQVLDLSENRFTALPQKLEKLAALQRLNLNYNQLTTLPSEFENLTALQVLDLSNNQLTALPPELGKLAALQRLDLRYNRLTALPPELGKLTALQVLNLNKNQLTALPPELGKLAALQRLDLRYNRLRALPPELGKLTALQVLDLSKNQLTALPPEFGNLTALQVLDLSKNQLTALPPEFGSLTALKELILSHNQLTTLAREFGNLATLQRLYLDNNQLSALPLEFESLTALQVLDLSKNQLTALPPEIGSLTALQRLYLDSNQITALPSEIENLAALQRLGLTNNQLTTLPDQIRQLTNLEFIFLENNPHLILSPQIRQFIHSVEGHRWADPSLLQFDLEKVSSNSIQTLLQLFEKIQKLKYFPRIQFYDSQEGDQLAVDSGGPTRDFITALFQALFHPEHPALPIKSKLANERFTPLLNDQVSLPLPQQILCYQGIGAIFGYALQRHQDIVIGNHLQPVIFEMLYALSEADLANIPEDIQKIDDIPQPIFNKMLQIYLRQELKLEEELIKEEGKPDETNFQKILRLVHSKEDIEDTYLLETLGYGSKGDFFNHTQLDKVILPILLIAKSMREILDVNWDQYKKKQLADPKIKEEKLHTKIAIEKLQTKIEGSLSKEKLLAALDWREFEPANKHHKDTKKFLEQWIESASLEDLGKFVRLVTGASTLSPGQKLKIYFGDHQENLPTSSTCFYHLHLPCKYANYEVFKNKLTTAINNVEDGFGNR